MERVAILLTALSILGASYFLSIAIYNIYFHPLRHFPGPRLWCAFRFPYVLSLQKGELHVRMKEIHNTYGQVVRLAPNELSFTDSRAWKDIYGNRQGHVAFERNRTWFKKATPNEPNSIMGPDEPDHARFRRTLVHAFSDKSLKEQSPMIESYVNLLIQRLKERGGEVIDLVEWLNYTTFDIAGDLSFGESFECLMNGKTHPWVEIAYDFGKGLALIASVNHYPPFDKLLRYILPAKLRQRMVDHRTMSSSKVQKRLDLTTDRPDFINTITKQDRGKGADAMTLPEIELNASILVFAGSETTATGLSGIVRMMLQNPEAMSTLVREVRAAFHEESDITIASVGQLVYMDAVIDEGLRVCPPVTIGVPRVVPRPGDTICGQWVPGDTYVTVNQYPTYRSPQNFARPDDFLPERFLPNDVPDEFSKDNMSAYQLFSIGRHACIGQSLAYAEMRLILARLLFMFDLRLADDEDVWDWGTQKTFIFWEKKALKVKLSLARG